MSPGGKGGTKKIDDNYQGKEITRKVLKFAAEIINPTVFCIFTMWFFAFGWDYGQ